MSRSDTVREWALKHRIDGNELAASDLECAANTIYQQHATITDLRRALSAIDGLDPEESVFSYTQDQLRALVCQMGTIARTASEGRE